jgi:Glycerol-3-phosphate dehydrogenase
MNNSFRKIVIIGAGSIGTALGNTLSVKKKLDICLLSIEADVVDSINNQHINKKYFPNFRLHTALKATVENSILQSADVVFLAIPSVVTVDYVLKIKSFLNPEAVIVNLAKGFGNNHQTIAENLQQELQNPVCALKGPTFALELINKIPSAFTIASTNEKFFPMFDDLFDDTPVYLDYSTDVRGVEMLSILKNIYAIVVGIVDAHFNSPNLRFLVLTKAFNEMRKMLLQFGGKEKTLFCYCGYGDFGLTALNDLSRNRTLGLLIGKGFFNENISDKVVLEGKIATNIFINEIARANPAVNNFHLIKELYKVFNESYDISSFVNNILITTEA